MIKKKCNHKVQDSGCEQGPLMLGSPQFRETVCVLGMIIKREASLRSRVLGWRETPATN